jgi:hypothetical protein
VVAAGPTGEAFYFEGCLVAHDFNTVSSDRFFDGGDFYLFGIIVEDDGAGFDAGRTMCNAGYGTKREFGCLSNSFLFKSVDGELDHGAAGICSTGSSVAFFGGIFTGVFCGSGSVLGVCKRPESEEQCENDNIFHGFYFMEQAAH